MYYNRFARAWMFDQVDCLLLGLLLGSISGSYLKNYLSEQQALKRLRDSIMKKSKFRTDLDLDDLYYLNRRRLNPYDYLNRRRLNPYDPKIRRIAKFALETKGGDNFNDGGYGGDPGGGGNGPDSGDFEFWGDSVPAEATELANKIRSAIEKILIILKERELKAVVKVVYKGSRLVIQLILQKCQIDVSYGLLYENLNTQVIIFTMTTGGAVGFTLSWLSVGAILVSPPLLIATFFARNIFLQGLHEKNYREYKRLIQRILEDESLREQAKIVFQDLFSSNDRLANFNIEPDINPDDIKLTLKQKFGLVENPTQEELDIITHRSQNFENIKSPIGDQLGLTDENIESVLEDEFGLVKNPTEEELDRLIQPKQKKVKAKTVYYRDFIDEDSSDLGDILDEIRETEKPMGIRVRNDDL